MRTVKILTTLLEDEDAYKILCCNAMWITNENGQPIPCNTRCAKFRIAERDTMNAKLMPKNPPKFCYCGTDIIGELNW